VTTVAPPVRKQKPRRTGPGSGSDRPWLVVVLNDDHNTFDGVAFALARTIPGVDFGRGMALANTIHNSGRAVVWSGLREQAEHYWEQLAGFGLTMAPLSQGG
jgi:ATP-dependent Clp protease adaptor protein ClpS